jgi:uncharacterized protein
MSKDFDARRLDVKGFAQEGGALRGCEPLRNFSRLFAETQERGADSAVNWIADGELRNPGHVNPEIWLHLRADAVLALTCQRCLTEVDMPVAVDRRFRFAPDEEAAAAQDEEAEEDVLALSRSFDVLGLVEDEMLMELPLAPRHEACPVPVRLAVVDDDFESAAGERENPFALLESLKNGKPRT